MPFNLVVRFTGLCAFVPNTSGKAMRVVLVDAPGMPMGGGMPGMEMDEAHVPALIFDTRDLAPNNARQPDDQFNDGNPMGICRLNDQDLQISPMEESALALTNGNVAGCPTLIRPHSLSWMAQLDELVPGLGTIDESCLAGAGVHPAVTARIRLTEGTLVTGDIAGTSALGWVQWKFGTLNGPLGTFQRAIAEVIELSLPILGASVTLSATRFRGGPAVPPLVLTPQNGNPQVTVWIKNMPLPDIKGTRTAEEVVLLRTRNRDIHFEHYSRLSAHDPGVGFGPIPTAVQACNHTSDPILGNPQCPTAAFKGSSNA